MNEINDQNYLEKMFIDQAKPALDRHSGGGEPAVIEPLEIMENGTYTAPEGVDGYSPVTVNVAASGGSVPLDTCAIDCTFLCMPGSQAMAVDYVVYMAVENGVMCSRLERVGSWDRDKPFATGMADFNFVKTIHAVVNTPIYMYTEAFATKTFTASDGMSVEALDNLEQFFTTTVPAVSSASIQADMSW